MKKFLTTYRWEVVVFALALIVRLIFFAASFYADHGNLVAAVQGADGYYVISENIIQGHGYSSEGGPPYTPNAIRPPVMPYFLALLYSLGDTYWTPLLVEIVLGALLPVIGMRIAQYVVRSRSVAVAAGIFLALEPFSIAFASLFYSETVFTFFLLLSLWAFCVYLERGRWHELFLSAGLLGLAVLTKPTAQYVIILYAAVLLWQARHAIRNAMPRVLVLVVVFLLVLSPWLYRNYITFGVVALSPQLSEQLSAILVPSVLSIANGTSFQTEFNAALARGVKDPNKAELHGSMDAIRTSVTILLAHPYALAVTLGNTALNFFIHDGVFEVLKRLNLKPPVLLGKPALFLFLSDPMALFGYIRTVVFEPTIAILFARLSWIGVTMLFFFGAGAYLRKDSTLAGILCLSMIAYFMLTTLVIGLSVTARYRMPINYLIVLFAAYGAVLFAAALVRRFTAWKNPYIR
jgi:4-amino-4-deoxy-L-arabinose transferase-like glycosyltransferase